MKLFLDKYKSALILPLFLVIPNLTSSTYIHYLMCMAGVYTIMALSLTVLTGFSGQISIGQGAFMAIGAYFSVLLTNNLHFPFLLSLISAGLITSLVGFLIGFPALRLEGFFLGLATVGFGVVIPQLILKFDFITNGYNGLNTSSPKLFGYILNSSQKKYYLILIICTLLMLGIVNLMKSKPGRALLALRDSGVAARAMGINVTFYKVAAFTISSFLAGIGGSLYAHTAGFISPNDFNFWLSINILVMVSVGGLGSIPGTVVGAIFLTLVPELFSRTKGLGIVFNGAVLILVMLFCPKGLVNIYSLLKQKIKRKIFFALGNQ
jgi:branched-chain amino acid transport system permease protein